MAFAMKNLYSQPTHICPQPPALGLSFLVFNNPFHRLIDETGVPVSGLITAAAEWQVSGTLPELPTISL